MIRPPKDSWFLPFGPVKGVSLVRAYCMTKFREETGTTCTEGELLCKAERYLDKATPVASPDVETCRPGCQYYLTAAGFLLITRADTLFAIKRVNASKWHPLPTLPQH